MMRGTGIWRRSEGGVEVWYMEGAKEVEEG